MSCRSLPKAWSARNVRSVRASSKGVTSEAPAATWIDRPQVKSCRIGSVLIFVSCHVCQSLSVPVSSVNDWRTMGGFLYYITTNVDSTTTAISYTAFTTQAQNAYNNGGQVNVFAVAPSQKVKMSSFDAASIRLARADSIRGQIVDVIVTDFGEADIMLNRHLRTADAIGIDRSGESRSVTANRRGLRAPFRSEEPRRNAQEQAR